MFTASHKVYADVILDYLDPENLYFSKRLYRDSCFFSDVGGMYIKDLRVIGGREMKDLILVDNAVYSFAY